MSDETQSEAYRVCDCHQSGDLAHAGDCPATRRDCPTCLYDPCACWSGEVSQSGDSVTTEV